MHLLGVVLAVAAVYVLAVWLLERYVYGPPPDDR
jgi:nitrate reductase NapE component